MSVNININNDVNIELLKLREEIIEILNKNKIAYEIPFDDINKEQMKETIIHLKDNDVELLFENDILKYIKMTPCGFNTLDTLINNDADEAIEHVTNIKNKIKEKFSNEEYLFRIENINTETMDITVILINKADSTKVRIRVQKSYNGDIFVASIKALD